MSLWDYDLRIFLVLAWPKHTDDKNPNASDPMSEEPWEENDILERAKSVKHKDYTGQAAEKLKLLS